MNKDFNGVSWNTQDLIGCKQAFCILYNEGVNLEVLKTLDFGCLDIASVCEELNK